MSERDLRASFKDILEASRRIMTYLEGVSYDAFLKDYKTQDAVIRNLEIIGEASKNVPDDERQNYANLPLKRMAGMRDRLIHVYFGINLDIVWAVSKQELPELMPIIQRIVDETEEEPPTS